MKYPQWLKQLALIPDILKIRRQFRRETGGEVNLRQPSGFNEKIQWYKLYCRDPLLTRCADKVRVRDYVAERIGTEILNEVYGVYTDPAEIDFDNLPARFVLKVNHSSGQNLFCADRQSFDRRQAVQKLKRYLQFNHYKSGREWAYKNIPRRILCEKYLEQNGIPPIDYKFFCFHGEPTYIQVDVERFQDHRRNIYDPDWNLLPCGIRWPRAELPPQRPDNLSAMLQIARSLSAPFQFVRVDLYSLDGKVLFSELTFYPGSGYELFYPAEWDQKFGARWQLANDGRGRNDGE